MAKHITLILLISLCCLLTGCNGSKKSPKPRPALDISESRHDSYELRKARDKAKIEILKNLTELEKAKHKILMTATENNIALVYEDNEDYEDFDIRGADYNAVDILLQQLPGILLIDSPILVASFVNLDNLNESSTFGRMVSEQISSRLKQNGYTTIELKLRTNVFIKDGSGEFLLSRELSVIGTKHRAQAVVVGSYAAASKKVYITVRIVNVADSKVLASYDYSMPMTYDVFKMLLKGKKGTDWL